MLRKSTFAIVCAAVAVPALAGPYDTTARQCAQAAAKVAPGTTVDCERGMLEEYTCLIEAPAKAAQTALDAIRNAAHACIQGKGGRKVSEAEQGKLYHSLHSDFYEFKRNKGVSLAQKWQGPQKDDPRLTLLIAAVD